MVPADLCVEASALGAEVDFRGDAEEPMWPLVARPLAANAADFRLAIPPDLAERERVATVVRALRLLKADIGGEVAVGAWIPGPLTLAMQVVNLDNLYTDIATRPAEVARVLDLLTGALAQVGQAYQAAGADFLTIHEMGGSPGVIGPAAFSALVLPRLQRLLARLSTPRVLSVCGKTTAAIPLLAQAGAEALSVDQTCDLAPARSLLGEHTLLFGNLDPVAVLMEGDAAAVRSAAARAIEAGVDAVWPGCDLPPAVPAENMRAFARAG